MMSEIAPESVPERLEQNGSNLVLLDIRSKGGFEDWHIPGSEHIDVYDKLKADPEAATEPLEQLPDDAEIVTVCGVGKVLAIATEVLQEMGYEATTLRDGMQGWGRVHRSASIPVDSGQLIQVARPGTGCLSDVFISDGEAIVTNPSQYLDRYEDILNRHDATLRAVLETHAHADHVSGARDLAGDHSVPYFLHPADNGGLEETTDLEDGQRIAVGTAAVDVIHTPGHTEGSITYDIEDEALLTGDTLFLDSVGRPDIDSGSDQAIRERAGILFESVQQLLHNSGNVRVCPSHHPGSTDPPATAHLEEVREQNETLTLDREGFVEAVTANVPETPSNHQRSKAANGGEARLDDDEAEELELGPNRCAAN